MGRLDEKVVIITGAAGGIGSAAAQLFVSEGAKVLLVDVAEAPLRDLASRLGERAASLAADVSNPLDAERYVNEAVTRFGGLDVLFANAGTAGAVRSLLDTTPEDFDRVLGVNVRGVWLGIKYAAPKLAERKGGSIIITSSVAGLIGARGIGPYVASKHAVVGLCKTAALELAPANIRVNAIHPGPIENRMMRSLEQQANPADPSVIKGMYQAMIPFGYYGKNEDIAKLALFLASDDSSYCTGASFVADGGLLAH